MDRPEIAKTTVDLSGWASAEDSIPTLAGLCVELSDWAFYFASACMPEEGLPLEEALRWACHARSQDGLTSEEQEVLKELDQLWVDRGLPDKIPYMRERDRLKAVEDNALRAFLVLKGASQAVHGTSRWLETFDLERLRPDSTDSRYGPHQAKPLVNTTLSLCTLNRAFEAIHILSKSLDGPLPEVVEDLEKLSQRVQPITTWLQDHPRA